MVTETFVKLNVSVLNGKWMSRLKIMFKVILFIFRKLTATVPCLVKQYVIESYL